MSDLFEAWPEIERRIRGARRACLLSDLDGTLAPIVDRPEMAELAPGAREALRQLAADPGLTVGVVSGRSLADLDRLIGLSGLWYVGNHGYEMRFPSGIEQRFYESTDTALLARLESEFAREFQGMPGVLLENKGPILAVHYRLVSADAVRLVQAIFRKIVQPHLRRIMTSRGKQVIEARLRGNCNKGTAVYFIMSELPAGSPILYFGDDVTDRDAFRVLGNAGIAVQVGPAETMAARYTLPGPEAVVEALRWIADLRAKRGAWNS